MRGWVSECVYVQAKTTFVAALDNMRECFPRPEDIIKFSRQLGIIKEVFKAGIISGNEEDRKKEQKKILHVTQAATTMQAAMICALPLSVYTSCDRSESAYEKPCQYNGCDLCSDFQSTDAQVAAKAKRYRYLAFDLCPDFDL